MSVLIKGMKMPKAGTTITVYELEGQLYASVLGTELAPLVEVPTHHGNLIDVGAMEKLMSDTMQGDIRNYPYEDITWRTAFDWLDHQPVIIEAEE